jgi:signal transduction histidine kinase
MQFYDVLASIIHDMKNSLGMVVSTLDDVVTEGSLEASDPKVVALQQEAKRLNNNLIELLTLYKIENERIKPAIDEVNVQEFFDEVMAENRALAVAKGIRLVSQCDPDLYGFFDEGLIRGVLNNQIGNGMRYTDDQLMLAAEERDGYLVISVEDNGGGFPAQMLEAQEAIDAHEAISEGRTQLGLYFASMVARMHRNREHEGFIKLDNQVNLKGGQFALWLP